MSVHVYVCVFASVCLRICMYMYVCACVCVYTCIWVHVPVCIYECASVCLYVYLCTHVCVCTCVCVCLHHGLRVFSNRVSSQGFGPLGKGFTFTGAYCQVWRNIFIVSMRQHSSRVSSEPKSEAEWFTYGRHYCKGQVFGQHHVSPWILSPVVILILYTFQVCQETMLESGSNQTS